jgi:hypothetical protein
MVPLPTGQRGPLLQCPDGQLGGLTVRCLRPPVLSAATSCGRTGCPDRMRLAAVRRPVTGAITAAWAQPLRPFCRSLDGHVRWSLCRWTPTGPLAAPRTAGARDPCRIAGRCPDPVPHNDHLQWLRCGGRVPPWCPAAGRVDRWVDTPTVTVPPLPSVVAVRGSGYLRTACRISP